MSNTHHDEHHDEPESGETDVEGTQPEPTDRIVPEPGEIVGDDEPAVVTPAPNGVAF
ncbi:MAG: hypothetical protein HKN24_06755 [Acidimicrobiales bacterium]|nr:hypothetical protein [Acidimicrobiales bacterium]